MTDAQKKQAAKALSQRGIKIPGSQGRRTATSGRFSEAVRQSALASVRAVRKAR